MIFQTSRRDAWLVAAAIAQAAIVGTCMGLPAPPSVAVVLFALSLWWGSNTVSHIHLHRPLFRARALNRLFSLFLSLLLGVPQSLWRERHLWHHAGEPAGRRFLRPPGVGALVEGALVAALWVALALAWPRTFLFAWLPGWLLGLGLCQAQGHLEHAGAGIAGISHYGALHNRLWFNDGYHAEHHRHPGEHWSGLPSRRLGHGEAAHSALPPLLRAPARLGPALNRAQARLLVALERLALAWPPLGRWMVSVHARTMAALLPRLDGPIDRVLIVGGGLFPRTALALRGLLPSSRLTLLDSRPEHLERARAWLAAAGQTGATMEGVELVAGAFADASLDGFDLVVLPLGFVGDRAAIYARTAPAILVHEWVFRRRGRASAVVSWLLLKRLNLV